MQKAQGSEVSPVRGAPQLAHRFDEELEMDNGAMLPPTVEVGDVNAQHLRARTPTAQVGSAFGVFAVLFGSSGLSIFGSSPVRLLRNVTMLATSSFERSLPS